VGTLPIGTNIIGVTVTDSATNTSACSTTVAVADTIPPTIASASASPNVLWPPNHKMVDVTVSARVTDSCSASTWKIIGVSTNQASTTKNDGRNENRDQLKNNGHGNGNTSPTDWVITGDHTLQLRAERSGNSSRVYYITIQATDASRNISTTKRVTVTVPKSQGGDK
jgi:hypothetical protein